MTAPVADIARATAQQLIERYGPRLPGDVEAALHTAQDRPQQYFDPVSIGGLIVAAASLAWTIYHDRKSVTPPPPPHVIVRNIHIELNASTASTDIAADERDHIIDTVVQQMLQAAPDQPHNSDRHNTNVDT